MPKDVSIKLYQYEELPTEKAKKKARDWWLEGLADSAWAEPDIEDIVSVAQALNITIKDREYRTMGGATRSEPDVYWDADEARFSPKGSWSQNQFDPKKVREYAPVDTELHRIADVLAAATIDHDRNAEFDSTRTIEYPFVEFTHGGRDGTRVRVEVTHSNSPTAESAIEDFWRWAGKQISQALEYARSEEAISEAMAASEYTFLENGRRFEPSLVQTPPAPLEPDGEDEQSKGLSR
jgi:hypothetical protein